MINKICEECGIEFEIYPSSKRKYCSFECVGKAQSKRQVGINNPCWVGGSKKKMYVKKYNQKYQKGNKERIGKQRKEYRQNNKQKICIRNKRYRENNYKSLKEYDKQKYQNRVKNNICMNCGEPCANKFFCDNICRGKMQSKRQVGKNNPAWKGKIKKICEECGERFFVSPCYRKQKCCSDKCKGFLKVGINNPNWKNGATSFNHKIRALRENKIWRVSVFERDKYTCVICGKVGGNLESHHINSFADILSKNKITSIRSAKLCKELWDTCNGITTCEDCHEIIDKHRFISNKK